MGMRRQIRRVLATLGRAAAQPQARMPGDADAFAGPVPAAQGPPPAHGADRGTSGPALAPVRAARPAWPAVAVARPGDPAPADLPTAPLAVPMGGAAVSMGQAAVPMGRAALAAWAATESEAERARLTLVPQRR